MDREGTQDIINAYLGIQQDPSRQSSLLLDDAWESDPLMDLLNYSPSSRKASPLRQFSPTKSIESPLKSHYKNLRGSPTKVSNSLPQRRRSFGRGQIDLDLDLDLDILSIADLDDNEEDQLRAVENQAYSYLPSTKYALFISKSTVKLRQTLLAEVEKRKNLEQIVSDLKSKVSNSSDLQSHHDTLIIKLRELQRQNGELEQKLERSEKAIKASQLSQENAMLRLKLVKYKTLYEEAAKLQSEKNSPKGCTSPDKVLGTSERIANTTSGSDPQERLTELDILFSRLTSIFKDLDKNRNGDLLLTDSHIPQQETSKNLQASCNCPKINLGHEAAKTVHTSDEGRQLGNDESLVHANLRPSGSHTSPVSSTSHEQVAHVAEIIEQIRHEIHNINATLRDNGQLRKDTSWSSSTRPSSDKSTCSACSRAASRTSTRPNTSSTPEVGEDGQDATRNLMGKYNWNRTI